jgi:CheY-like chemotaxis protein/uncharacterized Zn finger protein (UPF0148 family)
MNCPRCKTSITTPVNPDGIISCPGCGARLMTRAAARRSQGGPRSSGPDAATAPVKAPVHGAAAHPPDEHPQDQDPLDEHPPDVTAPAVDFKIRVGPAAHSEPAPSASHAHEGGVTLAALHHEIQVLQALQQETLDLLRHLVGGAPAPSEGVREAEAGPVLSPLRSQRRKSVLLVDDDSQTRDAARVALEEADVPVRPVESGSAALREIASEKPDVIVLELGVAGDMAGKDVINMIKATMEWVDIPIVLWTREEVDSQREARQIHGADEIVRKSSGPEALVACVISLFRRA